MVTCYRYLHFFFFPCLIGFFLTALLFLYLSEPLHIFFPFSFQILLIFSYSLLLITCRFLLFFIGTRICFYTGCPLHRYCRSDLLVILSQRQLCVCISFTCSIFIYIPCLFFFSVLIIYFCNLFHGHCIAIVCHSPVRCGFCINFCLQLDFCPLTLFSCLFDSCLLHCFSR